MLECTSPHEVDTEFFDQNGYLIVRNALDDESIGALIKASDDLINSDLTENRQRLGKSYDGFRNVVTLDDAFISLMDHPKILPAVVRLLGANLHVMTSHLIYKHPDPEEYPDSRRHPGWHRDYLRATRDLGNAAIPRLLVKCAYYLTDLTLPNRGATMIAPGSNHLIGRPDIPDGHADPLNVLEPSLQPGDCLIFENRTFHAGALHRGADTRKAVMIGYGFRWVVPMDYVTQSGDFLARLTPLQRYLLGGEIEDTVEYRSEGGRNPLREWCEKFDIPDTRHPQPQRL